MIPNSSPTPSPLPSWEIIERSLRLDGAAAYQAALRILYQVCQAQAGEITYLTSRLDQLTAQITRASLAPGRPCPLPGTRPTTVTAGPTQSSGTEQ